MALTVEHDENEEVFELTIDRLASGGEGVGRAPDGRAVFVPLAAPGDRLRVRVVARKRRFARAEIEAVLAPGPDRTDPVCKAFGRCGGCAWQHIDYAAQLAAKRDILADALQRIGRIELPAPPSITASPSAYGYRGRARLLARSGRVGYRARRSHDLCEVDGCPVLLPDLEAALTTLGEQSAGDGGSECEWELAAGEGGEVRRHRLGDGGMDAALVHLRVADDLLDVSPEAFAQANALLLGDFHARVCAAVGSGRSLLELYAGGGFFTLHLARRFDRVVAVESSRRALGDLARNLERAGVANVEVHGLRVESALSRGLAGSPEVILVDPPRTGLTAPVADTLAALGARRIAYVSCDPATLARDLARLVEADYRVLSAEAFDLFPQTPHVEALVVLEAGSGDRDSAPETTARENGSAVGHTG